MPDTSPAVRLARLVESGALDHGALGSLLGARRRALGRSQYRVAQQLCAAAGAATVSRHEVSRWERGERVPTAYWRRHLGRVLGLPAELLDAAAARARGTSRAGTGRAANSRTANSRAGNSRAANSRTGIRGPRVPGRCPADSVAVVTVHPVDRADLRRRVEDALAAFLGRQRARLAAIDPALAPVADAIDALVLGTGKRLRPAFGYWGYRGAGGEDRDDIVAALASLELVQASALIHDDVMDASDTRRGEPAMHRRFAGHHRDGGWHGKADTFGESAAILAGDLCLVWSDEMLHTSGADTAAIARARPVFDEMRTEVTVGQYLDVLTGVTGDVSVGRASKVATYKSAKYTVERPLLMGAALAGATPAVAGAYSRYGLALGEAFQLRDDVLGVFGDPAETGKPAGDDLREGKRTYLIATAFAGAGPADRHVLSEDLGDRLLDAERVDRLREIITSTGALTRTEARIDELSTRALDALAGVALAGGAGDVLTALAEASTRRRR